MFDSGLFYPNTFQNGMIGGDTAVTATPSAPVTGRGGFDRGEGGPGYSSGTGQTVQPLANG